MLTPGKILAHSLRECQEGGKNCHFEYHNHSLMSALESRAMSAPFNPPPPANTAPDLPRMARIVSIERETPMVKTFVFDTDIDAQPGQFIMLWVPGVDEKPMSIAGMRPLTISVAKVGPMTTALHALKEGDLVGWRGPFGRSVLA